MLLTPDRRAALLTTAATYHLTGGHDQRDDLLRLASAGVVPAHRVKWVHLITTSRRLDAQRASERHARIGEALAAWAATGVVDSVAAPQEALGQVVFFAGVEQAPQPLVEVCARLARLYESGIAPKLRCQAIVAARAGWALVRRARLQCGEEVEYTDLDAQHVKRVLARIVAHPREGWTDLDHEILRRVCALRGMGRV